MCAMVCTRSDLAYAVSVVSRYMHNPGKEHWDVVKWILRWKATLQSIAALSTTEAEYIAATEGVKEATWLWGLLWNLVFHRDGKQEAFAGIIHHSKGNAL
nr:Retrovirus-related Pol polyprotein from transposon TNT 1-94 [Ipomoea batatas]